jgi:hypothetical protein
MRLQAILVRQIMFIGKGGLHPKRNKAICIVSGLSTTGEASHKRHFTLLSFTGIEDDAIVRPTISVSMLLT